MTATPGTTEGSTELVPATSAATARAISVLLYSYNRDVRDAVRMGVGDHPAADVRIERWHECATPEAAILDVKAGGYDVLILDGESQPYGGMGISRQLKNEIFECPPILVLTGRPVDGWLATWSLADAALPRPLDPQAMAAAVADLARR
ncbi:MAG: hypothetical protein Q4P07_13130 [Ornithinimicrobium sp.]|uniref:hypothetical protein n=1 Tax=Ornithinimicrobium sp. TaxID=1977084 RepID=UPI0026DF5028|nr:hypothetical protein [Ornithinimicrobium sp.]MDO5741079.1 hypothetical protein [Ornithinimicrobium sp.]